MTASSPWMVGMMDTRKSMAGPHLELEAAVLGLALFRDVSSDITLMRLMMGEAKRLSMGSAAE